MGQILNRVINLAKSQKLTRQTSGKLIDDDDELKRIIDELNSSGEKKQKSEVKQFNEDSMNFVQACRILKIDRNANQEEIKKAYLERIKEYHPDRLENFGDDLKEFAKKRTQEINLAYSFLKNS